MSNQQEEEKKIALEEARKQKLKAGGHLLRSMEEYHASVARFNALQSEDAVVASVAEKKTPPKKSAKRPAVVEEEKKEEEEEEDDDNWKCAGNVLSDPPTPCPGGTDAHKKKATRTKVGPKDFRDSCAACKRDMRKGKKQKTAAPTDADIEDEAE